MHTWSGDGAKRTGGLAVAPQTWDLSHDRLRPPSVGGLTSRSPRPLAAVDVATVGEGIYTEAWTDRTYTELLDRAGRLRQGEIVVLDATWAQDHRRAARVVADQASADLIELRCVVDPETARARAAARTRAGADAPTPTLW